MSSLPPSRGKGELHYPPPPLLKYLKKALSGDRTRVVSPLAIDAS